MKIDILLFFSKIKRNLKLVLKYFKKVGAVANWIVIVPTAFVVLMLLICRPKEIYELITNDKKFALSGALGISVAEKPDKENFQETETTENREANVFIGNEYRFELLSVSNVAPPVYEGVNKANLMPEIPELEIKK